MRREEFNVRTSSATFSGTVSPSAFVAGVGTSAALVVFSTSLAVAANGPVVGASSSLLPRAMLSGGGCKVIARVKRGYFRQSTCMNESLFEDTCNV